jgi:gamma-glutamylcysteine synthetase
MYEEITSSNAIRQPLKSLRFLLCWDEIMDTVQFLSGPPPTSISLEVG